MDENINNPILNSPILAYARHKIILDDNGQPYDYEFLEVNKTFEKLTGLTKEQLINKTARQALPGIENSEFDWINYYGDIALKRGEKDFEQYSEPLDKWYRVYVYSTEKMYFTTMFIDITKNKEKNIELEKLYNILEAEFEKARKLHQKFLPKDLPEVEGLTYEAYYQPSKKLGGDFYNAIKFENELLFYITDVSGSGLDGSMMNIFLRETINKFLLYQRNEKNNIDPNKLIAYVAERYQEEDFPDDYFICLLVGVLNIEKMEIVFANSGFQLPPIKVSKSGRIFSLSCGGIPITSAVKKSRLLELYMSKHQKEKINLEKGDTVFLTTDGLIEELVDNQIYGEQKLKEVLASNYKLPANLINHKVKNDFKKFSGSLIGQDDLTFLTIKRDLKVLARFKKRIKSSVDKIYQLKDELFKFIAPYYKEANLICIGFQEIITNAIEHGNEMKYQNEVQIKVEITKEYIKAIISDEGEGFDWQAKLEQGLDIQSDIANKKERGRGIKIAKKLYDGICYNNKGNQVCLFKLRNK